MSKIHFHDDGTPSPHPTTKQTAVDLKAVKYDDREQCPTCGECSIKYTINDRCVHCARIDALNFHNLAVAGVSLPDGATVTDEMREAVDAFPLAEYFNHPGNPERAAQMKSPVWVRLEPCSNAGHLGVRSTAGGGCWFCDRTGADKVARIAARHAGNAWYTPADPCPDCGQVADRRVHDNRCSGCHPSRSQSPRQAAIAAGESWYTPDRPCRRCGQLAPRHVNNGRCRGCHPPKREASTVGIAGQVMQATPDLILSRADARAAGLIVYRTGLPCTHGHHGFRYTSTGACIDCIRSAPR